MNKYNAELNTEQIEKINKLEEELGIELIPYLKANKPNEGEYYRLYEDDRF